jgi:hypothetical protein
MRVQVRSHVIALRFHVGAQLVEGRGREEVAGALMIYAGQGLLEEMMTLSFQMLNGQQQSI